MKSLLRKLSEIERDSSAEKGDYSLFGLFLRENSPDRWELVAAAPWIEADERSALEFLASQVQSRLDLEEIVTLSRIVLPKESYPFVQEVLSLVQAEHVENPPISRTELPDFDIIRFSIITSMPRLTAPAVATATH